MKNLVTYFMPEIELQPDRPLRRIGSFILLFAVAASIMGLVEFSQEPTARYGWLPYLGSTVLLMAAAYILIPYKKNEKQLEPYSLTVLLIGILILALAAFMRFFRFDSMPFGTWNDEAYIGMIARNILSDPAYRPFFVGGYDHPLHFFALIALAFKFFGDGTLSIRLVTVLFGLGTVILSFFAGREISGNRLGLIFAFLFAISRWHVTFSRFGVYTNAMPFFELLTIWLLLRARRTMQVHDFLWAGLAFGYGLNFYIGIRLFIPVVLLYLAFWVIDTLRRKTAPESTLKLSWPVLLSGLIALFLAAWFAVAPLAQYAVTHPNDFWGRSSAVSIFSHRDQSNLALALYSNTVKHLLMFNYQGDPNGRHNLSAEPMLDPVTGILFIVGFVLVCIGIRKPAYSLFLMLFAFNLLGGILTVDFEAPQSNRAFGSISAAIFFAAIGFEMYWRELDKSRLTLSIRRLVLILTILCFGGFAVYYNATTYFVRQANSDRTWDEFNGTQSMAAKRMMEADPAHTTIYASVYLHDHEIIRFLDPQITDSLGIIPPIGLPVRDSGDKPVAIFVDGNNSWIVEEALKLYPNAQFHLDNTPNGNPALYSVLISPQDIQRLQGVTFSYWAGDNPQGKPALVRDEKSIQTSWASQPPIAAPFVAQLETTLYAPQYGNYELILYSPADASLWLDGELILDGAGEQHVTRQLAQGDHVLKIQAHSGNDPLDLQWRIPDDNGQLSGEPTSIPSSSLYLPALVPVRGLLGNYYKGESWSPPQVFSRIDPFIDMYIHIIPLTRPYTVDWSGQIEIPASGIWSFGLWINGSAEVFIDDKLVVNAAEPADNIEGATDLKAGRHSIHIRFLDYLGGSRIHLYWTAPGGQREVVPASALIPFP
ncbi:MAG: glycosyltransferase family 39 protein [Chloroflexi bacterium]|nr:glycosyltransferase family 39 protein [Chloroflexota bacterium]